MEPVLNKIGGSFFDEANPNSPPPSVEELRKWREYNAERGLKRYKFFTGTKMFGEEKQFTLIVFDTYLPTGHNLVHSSMNTQNLRIWEESKPTIGFRGVKLTT